MLDCHQSLIVGTADFWVLTSDPVEVGGSVKLRRLLREVFHLECFCSLERLLKAVNFE